MEGQKINVKQIITYAGAFIAFLAGSGFATGQEIMQYFVAYGFMGILGAFVVFLLFLYVGTSFILAGNRNKFPRRKDIFTYYCGETIGTFYDYFSVIFIYMSFIVMIGGAAATLQQQYGLSSYVGGIGIATLTVIIVILGLNRIIEVIGSIGPIIAVMSISLGIAAILINPEGLQTVSRIIPRMGLLKASTNWLFAAGSYVGFCMLWLATFMSSIGAETKSKKNAVWGAIWGALGFSLAVIFIALGLMANVEQVAGSMIPSLILAGTIHPTLAIIFSLLVIVGITTASVPLLWTVSARVADEKSSKFKIVTVILALIGTIIGLKVPFDQLVNFIYVVNGYVGIMLLVLMIIKDTKVLGSRRNRRSMEPYLLMKNSH
ncbi:MAG: hypothetical protein ACOX47_10145 [Bacillota bacterium]|jgi:uncharacterized membrane protein YkvI